MTFRPVLFWIHLVAGLISGLAIAVMCFTGTVLAFEKELVAWSERDARQVSPPAAGAPRLTIEQMQAKLRETQPDARPAAIVVQNDPAAAVAFTTGRTGGFYVNPYTGEVRQPASAAMSAFMRTMTEWHRYLGFTGEDSRARGKWINGVCNIAFCVLAITGLYLWMPRSWSWRAVRAVIWFRPNASSKARDFNWHNAIGFWTAPVLIILTLTAIPISFQWGGRVISALTGTPASSPGVGGPPGSGAAVEGPLPAAGATPLSTDALFAAAQRHVPRWTTITLRTSNGGGGPGGRGSPGSRGGEGQPPRPADSASREARPAGAPAATFTMREAGSWPRTATLTLALNPYTGEILRRSGYAELPAAQQVRSWTRFLHTGEALGWPGQFVAGLACLGGVFLVYTGVALSWRRFFPRRPQPMASTKTASSQTVVS